MDIDKIKETYKSILSDNITSSESLDNMIISGGFDTFSTKFENFEYTSIDTKSEDIIFTFSITFPGRPTTYYFYDECSQLLANKIAETFGINVTKCIIINVSGGMLYDITISI